MFNKNLIRLIFFFCVLSGYIFYNNFSFFVIQPIGAIPNGKTFLTKKISDYYFIDSADAVCKRRTQGVSLLCRAIILSTVTKSDEIVTELPYYEWLYKFTTNGKEYEN